MTPTPPPETRPDAAYDEMAAMNVGALWRHLSNLFPGEPPARALPAHWSYAKLRHYMVLFTDVLSIEEPQRRVLRLVSPGMQDTSATVTSPYAGIQIIRPGDQGQAHPHPANAFRF